MSYFDDNRGSNYTLYWVEFFIDHEELHEIAKVKDKQEAFPIIKKYLLENHKDICHYVITEHDRYTRFKNGNEIFRLYKT